MSEEQKDYVIGVILDVLLVVLFIVLLIVILCKANYMHNYKCFRTRGCAICKHDAGHFASDTKMENNVGWLEDRFV